tara:strand:+ start:300 stop:959 length:660 start_codon:yes stop_codon:yes gene_type:complete
MPSNDKFGASYKTLSVFGPKIGLVKLNDFVVGEMLEITDQILANNNRVSNGYQLAGQIKEEPKINLKLLEERGLIEFFDQVLQSHVKYVLKDNKQVHISLTDMWAVSQYENEYNPVHWHEGCTLSCALYLKIPEYKQRNIINKSNRDGQICFINNNPSSPFMSLENPLITLSPEVGDMYIFPSRMLHCVYPFQGPGERRSVSFNAYHQTLNSKTTVLNE